MSPPSRPHPATSSGESSRPVPAQSPAPQVANPARGAPAHWIGRGRAGRRGDPPRWEPGRPSLTPSLGRGVPAHNIRPAFRLRHPSGVKLSVHCARASASDRPPPGGPLRHLRQLPPGCSRPLPCRNARPPDRQSPRSPACAGGAPSPAMSERNVLTGSSSPPVATPTHTWRPDLDVP